MLLKIVGQLKSFVGHMGVYFMIVILSLSLLSGDDRIFDPSYYGIAVLFAFLLSLCSYILKIRFIKTGFILALLHIVFSTISFALSFIVASGIISGSTGFVGTVLFIFIDAIAMVIFFVYRNIVKNASRQPLENKDKEQTAN